MGREHYVATASAVGQSWFLCRLYSMSSVDGRRFAVCPSPKVTWHFIIVIVIIILLSEVPYD